MPSATGTIPSRSRNSTCSPSTRKANSMPVAAGMGLSILSEMAIQADHRVLTAKDGFAPIDRTGMALVAAPDASLATLRLADRLAEFCSTVQAKAA